VSGLRLPRLSGLHQILKVAACINADCSTTVRSVVDTAADPANRLHGGYSSVTFGRDGLALIAYDGNFSGSGGSDLKVARCLNVYRTKSTKITAGIGGDAIWFHLEMMDAGRYWMRIGDWVLWVEVDRDGKAHDIQVKWDGPNLPEELPNGGWRTHS